MDYGDDLDWFVHDIRWLALLAVDRSAEAAVERIRPFEPRDAQTLLKVLSSQKGRLLNEPAIVDRFMDPPTKQTDEWFASRLAIVGVLSKPSFQDRPIFVSISHTEDLAVAVGCEKQEFLLGIGIDIESSKRKLSPMIAKRIRAAMKGSAEEELRKWIRFEAAYKADPRSGVLPLSDYRFAPPNRFTRKGASIGSQIRSFKELDCIVAVAGCWGERPMP